MSPAAPLDILTVASFAERLGSRFRLELGSASALELELTQAIPLPSHARDVRAPFSIVFRGPREPVLPQSIYALEDAQFGRLELFIVPIGPDAAGMRYEAVFN
jgi:hypothetical protein